MLPPGQSLLQVEKGRNLVDSGQFFRSGSTCNENPLVLVGTEQYPLAVPAPSSGNQFISTPVSESVNFLVLLSTGHLQTGTMKLAVSKVVHLL